VAANGGSVANISLKDSNINLFLYKQQDDDAKRISEILQRYGSVFVAESYLELILSVHVTETAEIYSIVSNSQNHHIQKHNGVNTQVIADSTTIHEVLELLKNQSKEEKKTDNKEIKHSAWWAQKRNTLLNLVHSGPNKTPLYVYDKSLIEDRIRALKELKAINKIFYAIKANNNKEILEVLNKHGVGFECVSPGELDHIKSLFPDIDPSNRLLFTPNFAPIDEYKYAFNMRAIVTVDNIYLLEHHPEVFRDQSIFVRIDPEIGRGHHKHVKTAGTKSKFGVPVSSADRLEELVNLHNIKVIGLHAHSGSGILQEPENWSEVAKLLYSLAPRFPHLHTLNLGGGLGIPYRPEQVPLDLKAVGKLLDEFKLHTKAKHPQLQFMIEPGRFLVAESGVILCKMTQLKQKGTMWYLGVDSGFHSLIRPVLYDAYHEIVNLTRLDAPLKWKVDVVGVICESGDVLGHERDFPESKEGDVILIANTGAYGKVMSSNYNIRDPGQEMCLA
jgi:diaminopimelate decarboxylase/aspartate kinase